MLRPGLLTTRNAPLLTSVAKGRRRCPQGVNLSCSRAFVALNRAAAGRRPEPTAS
ncbi:hypothetical protein STAFG_1717 [Streptomyces afghaniensis 772]|uniref:Uncharacterized protein n=1 Tax=Streptomyces afghaniensis 772 TaxID=1283301 RepID=S4MNT0_9ACTN|nr:hypothetical protein STAFG_1717 [Streptomyces afghaniensis 772]